MINNTSTPPVVLDKQGRPITADRIIEGARAAGLRLDRGGWIVRHRQSCCAAGALCLIDDPSAKSLEDFLLWVDRTLHPNQRWGLSDGFDGRDYLPKLAGDPSADKDMYIASYIIGQEVYRRRHEAGQGGRQWN